MTQRNAFDPSAAPRRLRRSLIRITPLLLLAFVVCGFGSIPSSSQPSATKLKEHAKSKHHSKWKLAWSDEFNAGANKLPSTKKWVIDTGSEPNWGNQEWQNYTRDPKNISTDGKGHLVITARRENTETECPVGSCDITSGRIKTKGHFAQTYGRFEARIKVPAGQSLWPAFWMMGGNIDQVGWPNNGEIDVMEMIGSEPDNVYAAAHAPGFVSPGIGTHTSLPRRKPHHKKVRPRRAIAGNFHVFGVVWAKKKITWTLDGRPYFTLQKSRLKKGQQWVFDHPHYLLLNLAVGGVWPGDPDRTTPLPAKMTVDWVRVSKKRR